MNPVQHIILAEDAQQISVWDYAGNGPDLLLCHCTGGLARMWDPVAGVLSQSFRVLAVDTRGHGDSPLPASREACDWIHSGHDLFAVLEHFAVQPGALAAGHSAGGAHVAFAEYLKPGTFSRVALIDAIIGPRVAFENRESPLVEGARHRRNVFDSIEDARERLGGKPPMSRWDARVLDLYLQHGFVTGADGAARLKLPGDWEADFYEYGGACEVFEHLDQLTPETLVMTAEKSVHIRQLAAAQCEGLPRAVFADVPAATHFIPQERPEVVADLLLTWFGEGKLPAAYAAS